LPLSNSTTIFAGTDPGHRDVADLPVGNCFRCSGIGSPSAVLQFGIGAKFVGARVAEKGVEAPVVLDSRVDDALCLGSLGAVTTPRGHSLATRLRC
jgi:hypothetical protein